MAETLSVTDAMRRLGIEIIRASTTATTRIARPAEAILLGTPHLQPVIEITGMNTDPAGAPVEVSVAIARGDRIRLAILNNRMLRKRPRHPCCK